MYLAKFFALSTAALVHQSRRPRPLALLAKLWQETRRDVNDEPVKQQVPQIPDNLVLYCARHTFATDMLQEMSVVQVKWLLGHESLATTMKYLHPKTSGASDAVNRRNRSRGLQMVDSDMEKRHYDKTSDIPVADARIEVSVITLVCSQ
jgi:integrase